MRSTAPPQKRELQATSDTACGEPAPLCQEVPHARKRHPRPPLRCLPAAYMLAYTLKELPQPHVLFTFGLLNLNPEPSSVST